MQERARAGQAVRIGRAAAQQQRRRADAARGRQEHAPADRHLARGRMHAGRVHRHGGEFGHAVACQHEAQRARAGHEGRAPGERGGHRRHEHRLLGVERASHSAIPEIRAALDVAANGAGGNSERARAPLERRIVGVGRDLPRRDRQTLFHPREPRGHGFDGETGQPELALPPRERRGRRAERTRPVDGGAAADAAALQDRDRLVFRLARGGLLVELRVGFGLPHAEVARRAQRTLLHHQHRQPGVGQDLGGDAPARAGADDDDVGRQRRVAFEARRVDDVPARGEAGLERIGEGVLDGVVHARGGGPG